MNQTRRPPRVKPAHFPPEGSLPLLLPRVLLLLLLFAAVSAFAAVDRGIYPTAAPAGLERLDSREFDFLYVKPGFEPGNYGRLVIEEPEVAMDDYWKWTNRRDIAERDLKRIAASTSKILREQFGNKLSAGDGYVLARAGETDPAGTEAGVLRLRPAMINLSLNAPDLSVPDNRKTYIKSAGHATLYLDIYDGASGELLLRAIDRDRAREKLVLYEGNRATNYHDLSILVSRWAGALRRHLDALNSGTT
jgi:hypothetical protein